MTSSKLNWYAFLTSPCCSLEVDGIISSATFVAGKKGQAISFIGDSYVNVLDSASLHIISAIRIATWSKLDTINSTIRHL
jgi:hypothetical protein